MKLSIIIPVFNEAATLRELLRRVEEVVLPGVSKEIIIIDDASTDNTRQFFNSLDEKKYMVLLQERNQGKGAAMRLGYQAASGEIILNQDADLEYNPEDYPALLKPILEQGADVVYGSRFANLRANNFIYNSFYFGNIFLTWLSNRFTGLRLTDMETGYKVFRRAALEKITPQLSSRRFGIEPEITARVAQNRLTLVEVPIHYSGRTVEAGKKIKWRDGLAAVWHIVKFNWPYKLNDKT
ncbi:MAG TPA: glycosyltransferase family 2 protein [Candidatus Paceibacterota bacterium]|nr:glycosyltransferase family 2 protein [Candidatus Paceibacterota bacterium]